MAAALACCPQPAWRLPPFTALAAASRVIFGLHHPGDAAIAARVGAAVASSSLLL